MVLVTKKKENIQTKYSIFKWNKTNNCFEIPKWQNVLFAKTDFKEQKKNISFIRVPNKSTSFKLWMDGLHLGYKEINQDVMYAERFNTVSFFKFKFLQMLMPKKNEVINLL